jgi:hypothetical protein
MNKQFIEHALQLWGDPRFVQSLLEYFARMQQSGLEAARKYWTANQRDDTFPGNAAELFERMIAFYSELGFVSKRQFDELREENRRLREENEVLKAMLKELNLKVFSEGSLRLQQMWSETAQKQIETSAEIAKQLLELFKQPGGG